MAAVLLTASAAWTSRPALAGSLTTAQSNGLDLGTDAGYAFIDTGNTNLGWYSGPVNGNVLFGQGLTANVSGINNSGLGAGYTAYSDGTANISQSLPNPLAFVSASTSLTQTAASLAQSVSSYASTLAATQTYSNIYTATTLDGDGGLNVIDVGNIQNAKLTIDGTANDYFVFNVFGGIDTDQTMTLEGGITASHILFNLTGSSGTVLQTSDGDSLYGTFLATDGGQFSLSDLQLCGELIDTDGNVQFGFGSKIGTSEGFQTTNTSATPEPATLSLMLGACLVLACGAAKARRARC